MIKESVELQAYNTFGLRATAKRFVELRSIEEAHSFFKQHKPKDNFLILGGGSNLLLTGDYDGIVIKNGISGIEVIDETEEEICLKVGAGENWHKFVLYCVNNNYAGIENLSLIPGNVGAAPIQNIGAYGVEVKDVIKSVDAIKISSSTSHSFTNQECQFDYRNSIFKNLHKGKFFITSVSFTLAKQPNFKTAYGAIQNQLKANGVDMDKLSIKAISEAVIQIRQSKLPDPKEIGNSGSFFKNPIVEIEKKEALLAQFPNMPFYPMNNGKVKLAAGWLIEQANWKGYRKGDAGVHLKQALVLVNYGQATGKEIYDLSEKILKSIKEKFDVELEREVNVV